MKNEKYILFIIFILHTYLHFEYQILKSGEFERKKINQEWIWNEQNLYLKNMNQTTLKRSRGVKTQQHKSLLMIRAYATYDGINLSIYELNQPS